MHVLFAQRLGHEVLVVERTASVGSVTADSDGHLWMPGNDLMGRGGTPSDSADEALGYLNGLTAPADEMMAARRAAFTRTAAVVGRWLVSSRIGLEVVKGLPDCRPASDGAKSQGQRNRALAAFKDGRVDVLVATDVAARGLDIAHLPLVVNYDLPRSTDDYTHRIGRTGRAGESGLAISLVDASSEAHMRLIEKRQQLRVPREQITGFEPTETSSPASGKGAAAADGGGIKGKRKSKKDKLREAAAKAAAAGE